MLSRKTAFVILCSLAIVSPLGGEIYAQTEEPHPPYDIDSIFSFPGRAVIPVDSNPGYLILNGEFINSPYEIVLEAGALTVNGIDTAPLPLQPKGTILVDSLTREKARAFDEHGRLFQAWCRDFSRKEAQQRSYAYWQASPLVEKVYWKSETVLAIKYKGDPYEEEIWLHTWKVMEPDLAMHDLRSKEMTAVKLQRGLSQGDLVVKYGGFLQMIHRPRAKIVLDSIKTILSGSLDEEQKILELQKFIFHRGAVELIIERNAGN